MGRGIRRPRDDPVPWDSRARRRAGDGLGHQGPVKASSRLRRQGTECAGHPVKGAQEQPARLAGRTLRPWESPPSPAHRPRWQQARLWAGATLCPPGCHTAGLGDCPPPPPTCSSLATSSDLGWVWGQSDAERASVLPGAGTPSDPSPLTFTAPALQDASLPPGPGDLGFGAGAVRALTGADGKGPASRLQCPPLGPGPLHPPPCRAGPGASPCSRDSR